MASLKDIRARIISVKSTKKITSAMKMVSASKLHKTENLCLSFLPYKNTFSDSLANYMHSLDEELYIPVAEQRPIKKVAIVCFSSNSGLCGTFNTNISKLAIEVINQYDPLGKENIYIYTVGKKITDYLKKADYTIRADYSQLYDTPTFDTIAEVADMLTGLFLSKEIDCVQLVYNHYKNAGYQIPTSEVLLPLSTSITADEDTKATTQSLYIAEPSKEEFINTLAPKLIRIKLYAAFLDTFTSEHAARTTAMQIATENAEDIIRTITQQYNRKRQEVITNELLDIVGGSEALRQE
ncbi:MAG: ATP synthase F1 subunit gamma [Paludibacteraceae bacterium]|nr:ATP synthase F1 subunit gamma [Paludibacteraceae bacterium]MBP6283920.1 ATP synthase F1 subunit gamma [Paludibacteraceae bacterium]